MTTVADSAVVPTSKSTTAETLLELRQLVVEYGVERPARAGAVYSVAKTSPTPAATRDDRLMT